MIEEYRFAFSDFDTPLVFRAVSEADAANFVMLHYGLRNPLAFVKHHLQCCQDGEWISLAETHTAPHAAPARVPRRPQR